MKAPINFEPDELVRKGLNLHSVFNLKQLPKSIFKQLKSQHPDIDNFTQLILIGHGGNSLWENLPEKPSQSSIDASQNPIDEFTCKAINYWFNQHFPNIKKKILYPVTHGISLQVLGQLAHWHNPSPFLVGINNQYGTWFAYRAVVLTNSQFNTHQKKQAPHPCSSCQSQICIQKCPAQAFTQNEFNMDKCVNYRVSPNSLCQQTCLARVACPEGQEHKYNQEQLSYHYSISLKMIKSVK